MEYLKKFSEAIADAKNKKEDLQNIMGLVKLEVQNLEDHSRMMKILFTKYSCELELKEKLLKAVQESEIERPDSKKSVEEGLKKLDEKEIFLKGVLQEIHENKEQVERKANELDSVEKSLRKRAEEIDTRELKLDAREHDADEKEQTLQGRQNKLESREIITEVREKEIDLKMKILARREKEGKESIASRGRLLEKRENEMESELGRLEIMKFELLKKEDEFVNRVKENELKQRFSDLKLKLYSRKKSQDYIQESGSKSSAKPAEVVKDRKKRCFNSAISDADPMDKDGSGSKKAKRIPYSERSNGQLKLHNEKSDELSNPTIQIQNEFKVREFEVSAEPAQGIRIEGNRSVTR